MSKHLAFTLALALSSAGLAQLPNPVFQSEVKHYRLTFLVDSGQGEAGRQSFMLDVPVAPGKAGSARVSLVSGSDGGAQSAIQQFLECSNVHASATGLALHIAMQSDGEVPAVHGLVSARHQHGEFQRTVDLEMGKPTTITQEMQFRALGKTNPELAAKLKQPSPVITVTAEAL